MEDWNCGCQPCLSDMAPKWWWSSCIRWLSLFYWCERSTISMFSGEATCCICLPRYDFPISYSSFMNHAVCKIPVERCFCHNWKFHFHFPKNHWYTYNAPPLFKKCLPWFTQICLQCFFCSRPWTPFLSVYCLLLLTVCVFCLLTW
jgi:hypothetical protein